MFSLWAETPARRPYVGTQKICPGCAEPCDGVDDDGYPTCSMCDAACEVPAPRQPASPLGQTSRVLDMGAGGGEKQASHVSDGPGNTRYTSPSPTEDVPSHSKENTIAGSQRPALAAEVPDKKQQVRILPLELTVRGDGESRPTSQVSKVLGSGEELFGPGSLGREGGVDDATVALRREIGQLRASLDAKSEEASKLREVLKRTRFARSTISAAASGATTGVPSAASSPTESDCGGDAAIEQYAIKKALEEKLRKATEEVQALGERCSELEHSLQASASANRAEVGKLQRMVQVKDSELQRAEESSVREIDGATKAFTANLGEVQERSKERLRRERAHFEQREVELQVAARRAAVWTEEVARQGGVKDRLLRHAMMCQGDAATVIAEMDDAIEKEEALRCSAAESEDADFEALQESINSRVRILSLEISDASQELAQCQGSLEGLRNELGDVGACQVTRKRTEELRLEHGAQWELVRQRVSEAEEDLVMQTKKKQLAERDIEMITNVIREHDGLIAELHEGKKLCEDRIRNIEEQERACLQHGDSPGVERSQAERQQEDMCMVVFDSALVEAIELSKKNAAKLQNAYSKLAEAGEPIGGLEQGLDSLSRELAACEAAGKREMEEMENAMQKKRRLGEQIELTVRISEALELLVESRERDLRQVRDRGNAALVQRRQEKEAREAGTRSFVESLRSISVDFAAKAMQREASAKALASQGEVAGHESMEVRVQALHHARDVSDQAQRKCDELQEALDHAIKQGDAERERLSKLLSERDEELGEAEVRSQRELNDVVEGFKARHSQLAEAKDKEMSEMLLSIEKLKGELEAANQASRAASEEASAKEDSLQARLLEKAQDLEKLERELGDQEEALKREIESIKVKSKETAERLACKVAHLEKNLATAIHERNLEGDEAYLKVATSRDEAVKQLGEVTAHRDGLAGDLERARETLSQVSAECVQLKVQMHDAVASRDALARELKVQQKCFSDVEKKGKEQLNALEVSLEDVMDRLQSQKGELTRVKKERDSIKADLTTAKADFGALQQERDSIKSDLTRVQQESDASKADFGALQQERDSVKADLTRVQQERDSIQANLTRVQQESDASKADLAQAQSEVVSLRGQRNNLRDEFNSSKSELQAIRDGVKMAQLDQEAQLADMEQAVMTVREALREKEGAVAAMEAELVAAKAGYDARVAQLKTELEKKSRECDALQVETKAISDRALQMEELVGKLEEAERDAGDNDEKQRALLNSELVSVRGELKAAKEKLADVVEGEMPRLRMELEDAGRAKTDLVNGTGVLQDRVREQDAALEALKEEVKEMRLQAESKDKEVTRLAAKLKESEKACSESEREMRAKEQECRQAKEKVELKESECEQARQQLAAIRVAEGGAVDEFEDKVRILEENVSNAEERSTRLKKELEDKTSELAAMSSQYRELQKDLQSLEAQKSQGSTGEAPAIGSRGLSTPSSSSPGKASSPARPPPRSGSGQATAAAMVPSPPSKAQGTAVSIGLALFVILALLALWVSSLPTRVIPRIG